MEQVEIALIYFRETDDGIDRTESSAHRQITGALFIDANHKVLVPRNRRFGRLWPQIHLLEVLQTFQTLLAYFHTYHVKHFARRHRQLTPHNFVLGFGVAANFNFFNVGPLSFIDLKFEVHRAGFCVWDPDHGQIARRGRDIDIALGAVEILHRLGILGHSLGREDIAHVHGQAVATKFMFAGLDSRHVTDAIGDFSHGKEFVAGELNRANLVLRTLIDHEPDDHCPWSRVQNLHFLNLKVDVAVIAKKFPQLLLIVLKLLVLKKAAAGNPGKHPVFAGLDDFAQFPL